ncbi:hypothetical protein AHF37_00942 [Paragonimus kellicotti]|nr:hypothetical protein AHF37_00942 [Paragonimus kellicotti]
MMLDKRVEQPTSLEQRRQAAVYTESHPFRRMSNNCTVFLSYTSNMVSCGVRDIIRFIVQHNMNKIPVFCPGLTDGSIGDILFSHTYRSPGLRIDIVEDIRRINSIAIHSRHSGVIILGGGIIKHHTLNANLMRNGADYCVLINTGQEFDGSDSGARPDEAMSWGKLKNASEPVKVHADASLIFPLLVAQTFAKRHHSMTTTGASNGIA